MSRLELGRVGFKDRDITDLLALYGVTGRAETRSCGRWPSGRDAQGWWHDYSDVLPGWFEAYVGLEEAASRIRAYEIQFVPGLLQTAEYARAVTLLGHAGADGRPRSSAGSACGWPARRCWTGRGPRTCGWCSTRRCCAARSAARTSCAASSGTCWPARQRPERHVQVIPFQAGGHAAAGGPFSILRFAEPDLPDIVYLEQLTSALYLDKREAVEHYMEVMDRLCVSALPAQESMEIIANVLGRQAVAGASTLRAAAVRCRSFRRRNWLSGRPRNPASRAGWRRRTGTRRPWTPR